MAISWYCYYTSREGRRLEELPPQIIVRQKVGEAVTGVRIVAIVVTDTAIRRAPVALHRRVAYRDAFSLRARFGTIKNARSGMAIA
jgi:hypothetical protein